MKLTSVFALVAALGAEVALAAPAAQQAPVDPQPQPSCLPDGFYTSEAGVPSSACCSGYFANDRCQPKPSHLLLNVRDNPPWAGRNSDPEPVTTQATVPAVSKPTGTEPTVTDEQPSLSWVIFSIPTVTGPSTFLDTHVPIPVPVATVVLNPFLSTLSGPSTQLETHVPIPVETNPLDVTDPTDPGPTETSTTIPTVTGPSTYLDTHVPIPVATGYPHFGPGWDHSLAHKPFPTTLATVVEKSVDGTSSVHHVGPGWDHTVAVRPFPTSNEA